MSVRIGLLFQVFRTSQVSGRLVGRALAPTGFRGDEYAVYSYLLHGPMTLTDLAEGTGMPLTTAAGWVKRIGERGHLHRTPNPADGRSRLLALTAEARAEVLAAAQVFSDTVQYLDDVLAAEGIDADDLIDQLQVVQALVERSLERMEAAEAGAA